MPTLIVTSEQFEGDSDSVRVEGDVHRHLFRALRLKQGDSLRVVDGAGSARVGVIESIDRASAIVRMGEPLPSLEPTIEVELVIAQLRSERARWLVEKATELGVRRIVWMRTERSQHEWPLAKLARFERVARSAVEQCGRSRVLEQVGPLDFDEVVSRLQDGANALVAHCGPAPSVGHEMSSLPKAFAQDLVRILIGPEGGFTEDEVNLVRDAGCELLGLGARVLRVETAAIAVASRLLADGCEGPVLSQNPWPHGKSH